MLKKAQSMDKVNILVEENDIYLKWIKNCDIVVNRK